MPLCFFNSPKFWKPKDKIPRQTINIPSNSKLVKVTPNRIKETVATKIVPEPREIG